MKPNTVHLYTIELRGKEILHTYSAAKANKKWAAIPAADAADATMFRDGKLYRMKIVFRSK